MAASYNSPAPDFRRVAVLGTGLIGGSFALALRRVQPDAHVVGWDRTDVLHRARERGAIHEGFTDLEQALRGADFVYIALPILNILDRLQEIARLAEPAALVTDSASTKAQVCGLAAESFRAGGAEFFSSHPMAGKELGGIEVADGGLFLGATFILIGEEEKVSPRARKFVSLIAAMGAKPMWMDAATHDWAVAVISHLPQMVSLALAGVLDDEIDETGLPATITSRGMREQLRLAGSPYNVWRDIIYTNSTNIERTLDRLIQALDTLRTRLRSRELEGEFTRANEVYKMLKEMK
jgi:prephenate dehydrogenase